MAPLSRPAPVPGTAQVSPAVGLLERAVQACADAAADTGLVEAVDVVALLRLAEQAQAVALRALAAFDRTSGYATSHPELGTHPHRTAAGFLQQTLRLSGDQARVKVALARRVAPTGDLAPLGDLAASGACTLEHVAAAGRGVRGLDPELVAEVMPAISALVQATDPVTVARELRERAHAVSDELAREQEKRQRERRGVWLSRSTDGVGHLKGLLPALEADLLEEALARVMQRERTALDETGQKDERDLAQRRSDALTTLARHALTSDGVGEDGPLVGAAGVRAAVTVVVTAEQLAGIQNGTGSDAGHDVTPPASPARTTSSAQTVLSRQTLLELTCDADLTRVTLDTSAPTTAYSDQLQALLPSALGAALLASPVVLDLGRTTRTVTPAQWRALVARDRTCVRPGCSRPAARCVAHHVQHWSRGGPSDLDNYVLLCHQHHHELHTDDTVWHRHRDGRWLTPDGFRPASAHPPDLRSISRYGPPAGTATRLSTDAPF